MDGGENGSVNELIFDFNGIAGGDLECLGDLALDGLAGRGLLCKAC
jgi:hypothetical protein